MQREKRTMLLQCTKSAIFSVRNKEKFQKHWILLLMYVSITKLIIAFFSIFRDHCETERQDKQLSLRGQQRPRMRLNFVQTMCTSSYLSFIFLGLFRHLSGINDTAITHRCTFAKSLNLHINIAADDGIVLQGPDHLPLLSITF